MSKAAIISLGHSRITINDDNITSVNKQALRNYLLLDYNQVDLVSKRTEKEVQISYYRDYKTTALSNYDAVYVVSSGTNYPSGSFPHVALQQMIELTMYKGELIYFQIDPEFPLRNFAEIAYQKKSLTDRVYVERFNKLKWVIACSPGLDEYYKNDPRVIGFEYHYFNEHKAMTYPRTLKRAKDKRYDFIYWGYYKGNRKAIITELADIENTYNLFLGFDPKFSSDYSVVEVGKRASYKELIPAISQADYTVLVASPNHYKYQLYTPRFFETLQADLVPFIYTEYDPKKLLLPYFKKLLYVKTRADMIKSLEAVYRSPNTRSEIRDYCADIIDEMKALVKKNEPHQFRWYKQFKNL